MVKIHTTLMIDEDYRRQARELGINLSEVLNDALSVRFAQVTGDASKINEELEKKRLKKAQKELIKWQNEAKNAEKSLEILEKIRQESEVKALETQKKELEELKKCVNCGIPTQPERLIDFPIGRICRGCYMSASGQDVKRWNIPADQKKEIETEG